MSKRVVAAMLLAGPALAPALAAACDGLTYKEPMEEACAKAEVSKAQAAVDAVGAAAVLRAASEAAAAVKSPKKEAAPRASLEQRERTRSELMERYSKAGTELGSKRRVTCEEYAAPGTPWNGRNYPEANRRVYGT